MKDKKDNRYSTWQQLGLLGAIPGILVLGPLLGYFCGHFLDTKLGTDPYLMYLFIILGFVAAGREVYMIVKKTSQ